MIFGDGLEAFIDVAKDWEGFENFIPSLESYRKEYIERAVKSYTPNSGGFNVLNHADFHLKNMLFKKDDEGKIKDFYFVSTETIKFFKII